uniref:Uncharacterized protein n=1 Tax=Oryza glumipatula TaxID=40148 RepID=A0A0E0AG61_9ORYZ
MIVSIKKNKIQDIRRRGRGACSTSTRPYVLDEGWRCGASSRRPGGRPAAARWRSPWTDCCSSTCSVA